MRHHPLHSTRFQHQRVSSCRRYPHRAIPVWATPCSTTGQEYRPRQANTTPTSLCQGRVLCTTRRTTSTRLFSRRESFSSVMSIYDLAWDTPRSPQSFTWLACPIGTDSDYCTCSWETACAFGERSSRSASHTTGGLGMAVLGYRMVSLLPRYRHVLVIYYSLSCRVSLYYHVMIHPHH